MKPRLVPLYFSGRDAEFDEQLGRLRVMLADDAEILPELPLGAPLPACEAVLFPQILGEAYRSMEAFHRITAPILTITSEFGTVSMWDWEIAAYLRAEGLTVVTPYSLEMTRQVCRVLGVRRGRMSARSACCRSLACALCARASARWARAPRRCPTIWR